MKDYAKKKKINRKTAKEKVSKGELIQFKVKKQTAYITLLDLAQFVLNQFLNFKK